MSSSDAIATVTATLQNLLTSATTATSVTTKSPGVARTANATASQINIFLYALHYNTAFSNSPMPNTTRAGESAHPPMALVLKYIITAYGEADDDISGQQLLGQAMSLLHDHPLLGRSDIVGITPDSGLQDQVERIRFSPDVLSIDDISKLWSSFQSVDYRLSATYEASVVLIESQRPQVRALPVLRRGSNDQGPAVIAGAMAELNGLRFANHKPTAELGDLITLLGKHLTARDTIVRLEHELLDAPIELTPEQTLDSTEMNVKLPDFADDANLGANWPAGFYRLSLVTQQAGINRKSNSIALQLSPQIELVNPTAAPAGNINLTVECLPQVRAGQQVSLYFGSRQIAAASIVPVVNPTQNSTINFLVEDAEASANAYTLRIRIDGVDSIPIDFSNPVPQFDPAQQVTVT